MTFVSNWAFLHLCTETRFTERMHVFYKNDSYNLCLRYLSQMINLHNVFFGAEEFWFPSCWLYYNNWLNPNTCQFGSPVYLSETIWQCVVLLVKRLGMCVCMRAIGRDRESEQVSSQQNKWNNEEPTWRFILWPFHW